MNGNNNIYYFGGSDKGKKPTMEDRRIEISNLKEIMEIEYFENNNCKLFGVLDGHGGVMVANWLKDNLPIIICKKLIKYHIKNETKHSSELKLKQIQDIQKALHAAFKTADKKVNIISYIYIYLLYLMTNRVSPMIILL